MTETPDEVVEVPKARHLKVEQYDDGERVEAPDWYDDTINVGDDQ